MRTMVAQRTVTLRRPRQAHVVMYGAVLAAQREYDGAGIPRPTEDRVEPAVVCQYCGKIQGTFVKNFAGNLVHRACMSEDEGTLWERNRAAKRRG